jgi:hypothetical protein
MLALAIVVTNVCTCYVITCSKRSKSVFDLIWRAHTIPDGLIGLLQVTSYCTYTTFNYWPLGKTACLVYCSLDYALPHISILHTFYLAYVRVRSLLAPLSYNNELLIKHTNRVIGAIWFISCTLWIVPINVIMLQTFENNGICNFTYDWKFILLFGIVVNLVPILMIAIFTLVILVIIWENMKLKRKLKSVCIETNSKKDHADEVSNLMPTSNIAKSNSSNMAISKHENNVICNLGNLSVSGKLLIILFTFLFDWLPFCVLWIIDSSCACINSTLYTIGFWLTYFQSLMNPTWILVLNFKKYE